MEKTALSARKRPSLYSRSFANFLNHCFPSMKEIRLTGSSCAKLSKVVSQNSRPSELTCWNQPLLFYPDSIVLHKQMGGNCAIFAILQSYIVHTIGGCCREVKLYAIVHEIALDLVFRLCKCSAFCLDFSDSRQICRFIIIPDRGSALKFLTSLVLCRNDRHASNL
jgi:hypothetical protein